MEISVLVTIAGFLVQVVLTVLSIGHYTGKFETKIMSHDSELRELRVLNDKNYEDLQNHKENHTSLKEKVAVNEASINSSLNGLEKEMKETKEALKDFTREIKEWMKEIHSRTSKK